MHNDTFERLHTNFNKFLKERLRACSYDPNFIPQTGKDAEHFDSVMKKIAYDVSIKSMEISKKNNLELAAGFSIKFLKTWGYSFSLSEVFCCMAFDLCTEIKTQRDQEHITAYVLSKLLGKAIKTYSEINVLLKNGYPQGAMALTRIIIEIMVFSRFIYKNGDEVALDFHNEVNKPMNQKKDNYEWARKAKCFIEHKNSITFSMIMTDTLSETVDSQQDVSQHDDYARLCKYAHASAQTIIREPHLFDEIINTGPSMFGIEESALLSIDLLKKMLCDMFKYFTDFNTCRRLFFILGWADMIKDEYMKVAKELINQRT